MEKLPRISIIGAGIGGASAAHFISELFPNATLDIYEASSKVGGRLATIKVGGHNYEAGGSVIHDKNQYMVGFLKKFGLKKRKDEKSGVSFAVFHEREEKMLFKPWKYIGGFFNTLRFIWACGILNFVKLTLTLKSILGKFSQIYDMQGTGTKSYKTPEELLAALHLSDLCGVKLKDYLSKETRLSKNLISKLILPAMRMNYGQGLDVPAFVGMVSIAAGMDGSLWAVHGGNALIVENLIADVLKVNRNARLFKSTRVRSVTRRESIQGGPRFELDTFNDDHKDVAAYYDIVILSVPLRVDDDKRIQFHNVVPDPYTIALTKYHPLWVYHCDGRWYKPNSKVFGQVDQSIFGWRSLFCDAILTTEDVSGENVCSDVKGDCLEHKTSFNSIGYQKPVNYGEDDSCKNVSAIKIFANNPLEDSYIAEYLLEKISKPNLDSQNQSGLIKSTQWYAYPEYHQYTYNKSAPPFMLSDDGLYHVEAIEWAASAMEMSVIGAKNVALLVRDKWIHKDTNLKKTN